MKFRSLYGQVAGEYVDYRPEYPPEVFDKILAAIPPGRRGLAMDLGAGTGKAALILAPHFAKLIAVEADPLMAEKLRCAAPNLEVRVSMAEDLTQEDASADLVNIATALRWMNAPRALSNAAAWLRSGGILAAYGYFSPDTPEPARSVMRREFEERWNIFYDERLKDRTFEQATIRQARGLRAIEDTVIPNVIPLSPRQLTGFCRSTSYGSAYARTLADPENYWSGLESRFREASRDDKIPTDFSLWFILARRI